MKVFTILCLLLTIQISHAMAPQSTESAYTHLYEVNKEWASHANYAPAKQIQFSNDIERIRYHLELVEAYLRAHTPEGLTALQLARRTDLLDELKHYAARGSFPINRYHAHRQPYFIDHRGVHCAVGYLIKQSGYGALARRIHDEQNYAYVREITVPGLLKWAKEFGFEVEELAWIQPAYWPPSGLFSPKGEGTNGPIHRMIDYTNALGHDGILFGGEFSLLDSLPCNNIGLYSKGNLSCFGNGIDGKVNDLVAVGSNGDILAGGLFDSAGTTFPLAYYDSSWHYMAIPGRPQATALVINTDTNNISIQYEVVITDTSTTSGQELWYYLSSGVWQRKAIFYGELNDFEDYAYGGAFDSVKVFSSDVPDTVLYAYNIIFNHKTNVNWDSISCWAVITPPSNYGVCDTIFSLQSFDGVIYIGGSCSDTTYCLSSTNGIGVAGLSNGFIMRGEGQFSYRPRILDMHPRNGQLMLAGEFFAKSMNMFEPATRNVGFLNGVSSFFTDMTNLGDHDSAIANVIDYEYEILIGGNMADDKFLACHQTISNSSVNLIPVSACDQYLLPNNTYTDSSVIYYDTIITNTPFNNQYYWRDIDMYMVNVNESTEDSIQVNHCGVYYLSPSGNHIWIQDGQYQDTILNAEGCDSVLTIDLVFLQASYSQISPTALCSYTSPSGLHTWNLSGVYYDTLVNQQGCDSIITINLTVLNSTTSSLQVSTCGGYWSPSGQYWTQSGQYVDIIPNAAGCDSVISIDLTILGADATINQVGDVLLVNANDSYQWVDCGNNYQAIPGATLQTFTPTSSGSYAAIIQQDGCIDTTACQQVALSNTAQTTLPASWQLSPNPTTSQLSIQLHTRYEQIELALYDLQGRLLHQASYAHCEQIDYSLGEQPAGLYLLKITTNTDSGVFKVVKE